MFCERVKGLATMTITGELTVNAGSKDQVVTKVANISVATTSTVGEASATGSCFDVLRGGIMADPAHASEDLRVLLLAAIYAYFADVTSRSGGGWTASRMLGQLLYFAAWRLLGIDVNSATEAQRQELGKLIARLFECWCEAMLYPGPRCSTDHHGVYLGCATITQLGQIVDFDMWEHRREVITGPLSNHWRGGFGFAPIDGVAGRISQAICCLAGLQIPTLATQVIERQPTNVNHYDAVAVPIGMGSVAVGAASPGAATDVSPASLIAHVVSGLVGATTAPLATYRSRLADGTVVEAREEAIVDRRGRDAIVRITHLPLRWRLDARELADTHLHRKLGVELAEGILADAEEQRQPLPRPRTATAPESPRERIRWTRPRAGTSIAVFVDEVHELAVAIADLSERASAAFYHPLPALDALWERVIALDAVPRVVAWLTAAASLDAAVARAPATVRARVSQPGAARAAVVPPRPGVVLPRATRIVPGSARRGELF